VQIHNQNLNEPGGRENGAMKKVITAGIVGLFAMLFSGIVLADDLTITYTLPEVSSMSTDTGDGLTLTLAEPAAGQIFAEVTDTFTISVSDNTGDLMKVAAHIESVPPECENGLDLLVAASPGIGTPEPEISIAGFDRDLITGIQSESGSSTVTLRFQADMTACTVTNATATLVITYSADS
jgi:hypothetical protein